MDDFIEFSRLEKLAGGPDPHMKLAGRLAQGLGAVDKPDIWWVGGCYIGVYNYPTAEMLLFNWPLDAVLVNDASEIEEWLTAHWDGIETRRERRSVRTPRQLARFLKEYAGWCADRAGLGELMWAESPEVNYERLFRDAQGVYSLGRYVALKLMEFLRRYADAPISQPDLRLLGGWSPMEGLALIFPEHADLLELGDRSAPLGEDLGFQLMKQAFQMNVKLDNYEMQVLLCDFKQMVNGRQYPGRSQDSELDYEAKIAPHWGGSLSPSMRSYRKELFPEWALGELHGWSGVRKPLTRFYGATGTIWTDSTMSYPDDVPSDIAEGLFG